MKGKFMHTTPAARKLTRLAVTTVVTGATVAFLFLGAPADAAVLATTASRGI
jgi:hypothetical protein